MLGFTVKSEVGDSLGLSLGLSLVSCCKLGLMRQPHPLHSQSRWSPNKHEVLHCLLSWLLVIRMQPHWYLPSGKTAVDDRMFDVGFMCPCNCKIMTESPYSLHTCTLHTHIMCFSTLSQGYYHFNHFPNPSQGTQRVFHTYISNKCARVYLNSSMKWNSWVQLPKFHVSTSKRTSFRHHRKKCHNSHLNPSVQCIRI